jgi:hypothetical protein
VTIYTFPASLWHAVSISFSLEAVSASTPTGAFNSQSYQSGPTVELTKATVQIAPLDADGYRELAALLRKLRGRLNKIRLYDPARPLRGAGAAGPTINIAADAAAGATSIEVSGLTISQAEAIAADDVIGIGENLHFVSDSTPSDSSGNATLSILPPLRSGVTAGDAVTLPSRDVDSITGPTGLFMLVTGASSLTIVPGQISQPVTLEFMESPDFD